MREPGREPNLLVLGQEAHEEVGMNILLNTVALLEIVKARQQALLQEALMARAASIPKQQVISRMNQAKLKPPQAKQRGLV